MAIAALFFVAPRPAAARARTPFARVPARRRRSLVVLLSYLFYRPFDVWWYLRFLLPMWPVMMLLTAAALRERWRADGCRAACPSRWPPWWRSSRGTACAPPSIAARSISARANAATSTSRASSRATPNPDAVILSVQHSGSLRLYAERLTLRYDALDPLWLDRTVAYLQSIGRRPYYVLDGDEVDAFRRRFGAANRLGALDWPPMATLGGDRRVYDPIDRRPGASPMAIATTRGTHALCDTPQSWPPVLRIK